MLGGDGVAILNKSLNQLGVHELLPALQSREVSATALAQSCIERVEAREPEIGAWAVFSKQAVLEQARVLDDGPIRGVLHGIPIAVKDIIDTRNIATERGSEIYRGRMPQADAACVAAAKAAGAIIMGKSVTTEFAYFRPGKTANPHNTAHTPGGSSSGSAAAVADFMTPLGFGTQTAASLIRPAAYCGIVGYKASKDLFSLEGVQGLAPSLDTLGCLARDVEDVEILRAALSTARYQPLEERDGAKPAIGICRTYEWAAAEPATVTAMERAANHLSQAGARVKEITLPAPFKEITAHQKLIMAYEAARTLAHEYASARDALSAQLTALIEEGQEISDKAYQAALDETAAARQALKNLLGEYDALIAPSAPGEAPEGLAATGDPIFSRMWNMLHVPQIALPVGTGPANLPIGVQLIGAMGQDRALLAVAKWAQAVLAKG